MPDAAAIHLCVQLCAATHVVVLSWLGLPGRARGEHPTQQRGTSTLWHLCVWIERMPGGTRQNDGLETGIMGAAAARFAWVSVSVIPDHDLAVGSGAPQPYGMVQPLPIFKGTRADS